MALRKMECLTLMACYYVNWVIHAKDPQLFVERVRHDVQVAGFCMSLNGLHVLNRDSKVIQTKKQNKKQTNEANKVIQITMY